jgi:asparaginyl-tRNA synthetase
MKRTKIVELLKTEDSLENVLIKGWVRTRRDAKTFSFIEVNDGSTLSNIQIVADDELDNYGALSKLTTGSAVAVQGSLVASQGKGQKWELLAGQIDIISLAPDNYPLQKKRHTDEYLRKIAHLRPRTNKYGAIFRIRSELSFAIHKFFQERAFRYIHTPIITSLDCEGAGELFRVTHLADEQDNEITKEFFGKEANLTVSGQLAAEMFALSLGDVYTFGPTFRAENSNTRRHAAEFWMVEPELAFCDLADTMSFAEEMIKYLIQHILDQCENDIQLFARFVDKSLLPRLEGVLTQSFECLAYKEAIELLARSKRKFDFPTAYGLDLQTEHERYLTEVYFKRPVIVYDYPAAIKPFYMRLNDDRQTVAAMDVLVPQIGEIIGGSQREERYDILKERMQAQQLDIDRYWWYLESRTFGTVPHSGFGMGFERLLMFVAGVSNIRDVIPFPRTPNHIEF